MDDVAVEVQTGFRSKDSEQQGSNVAQLMVCLESSPSLTVDSADAA